MKHPKPINRRVFLRQLVTTAEVGAVAAVAGCKSRRPRWLIPDVVPGDDVVPGQFTEYRTVCRGCSARCGSMARVREGRAIKLEGNSEHPVSRGALCIYGQAVIESLYSPDRLSSPVVPTVGIPTPILWKDAEKQLADGLGKALAANKQIAILTRPEPGAVGGLLGSWLEALGQKRDQVVVFDPTEPVWLRDAARTTFGVDAQPIWDLSQARLVVALGADLLEDWGSPVEHARRIAELRDDAKRRLVYVGPRLSLTAASAHEHIDLAAGDEASFVLALLAEVLELMPNPTGIDATALAQLRSTLAARNLTAELDRIGVSRVAVATLARDLVHNGPGLVVGPGRIAAGDDAVELAQAVYLIDAIIGATGHGLSFPKPAAASMPLAELVRRANAGQIGALVVHHADPLAFGPMFEDFERALDKIPFVVAIANRLDATAAHAKFVLADHHDLEHWDTVPTRPGVEGIQQPVMTPVHDTRAAADILVAAARHLGKGEDLVDETFAVDLRDELKAADIERGGVFKNVPATVPSVAASTIAQVQKLTAKTDRSDLSLVAAPSLRYLDGAPPVSELLQELPDPLTSISWSPWVEVPPTLASRLSVHTGDVVELSTARGKVALPAFVSPGVRSDVVAAPLPYVLPLLSAHAGLRGRVPKLEVKKTGRREQLALVGGSLTQHGFEIVREVDRKTDRLPKRKAQASLYDATPRGTRRWALSVDLDRCTGCGACAAACMVENNCPVVGRDEVANGRDMSWIRIDRYFTGPTEKPRAVFMPVMCQHCEAAPCEPVCPVYATYHTSEGLNAQIYNRCVGTRFCENNCPYVARRFNWFDWPRPEPTELGLNPDVTVRERGVTEKCTFCIQRIRSAEEQAKIDGRPLRDGEVVPACVQTCASEALVFGDLYGPKSRVSKLAASARAYHLLEELNTRPGVVYLARRHEKEPA